MVQKKLKRDPTECLPLKATEFHILISLAEGDKHGYAIVKDIAHRTEGEFNFNISTLYQVIHRMKSNGLIEKSENRPVPALDDERRQYFRLTDFGRGVGHAEAARLETLLETARVRELLSGPGPA